MEQLYRWVKASERLPESKPEMDNNESYSFYCKIDDKVCVLYFWSSNWWGKKQDGKIYGISETIFDKLEWLEPISGESSQDELWGDAANIILYGQELPGQTIEELKIKYHLIKK